MNNRPFIKFLLCAGIPLLILFSMTATPLLTILFGQEIVIKTQPVDPRDVFRGDYVALGYEINEIPLDRVPPAFKDEAQWQALHSAPLYVILKKDGEFHVVDRVLFEKPKDGVYLKAYFQDPVWPQGAAYQGDMNIVGIRVTYNLDQYFLPENTGTSLESLSRRGQLSAWVKVWKGYATLIAIRP